MAEGVAWVLNLDAEDELAHPGAHTPTAAMTARIAALIPRLAGLIQPGDQVLWPGGAPVAGMKGRAWCPTRWALEQLERAGALLPRAPAVEVLRRANHRRFSHALGQSLPGAGYAGDAEELAALLSVPPGASSERRWLLKRPLGYAGRGRRLLGAGPRSAADQAWLDASLRSGEGLQVEPYVSRELDCALHGWLEEDGACTFGRPTLQEVEPTGAWRSTVVAPDGALGVEELALLAQEARRSAAALHELGYFGPFGLDAFRWRAPDGRLQFQARSEINARYSMGWATGMQGFRPAG